MKSSPVIHFTFFSFALTGSRAGLNVNASKTDVPSSTAIHSNTFINDEIHLYIKDYFTYFGLNLKCLCELTNETKRRIDVATSAVRPWNTMECRQAVAWTISRSLLLASSVKALTRRSTNSGSTLPRAAHQESGSAECNKCLHLALGKCSGISRHATNPSRHCLACLPTTTFILLPAQYTMAMTNYTHI